MMHATVAYSTEVCRLYVFIVLVFSAGGKALSLQEFRKSLSESFHASDRTSGHLALGVVGAETSAAVLLAAGGVYTKMGLIAAMSIFLTFASIIVTASILRRKIYCNCFGGSSHPISGYDLLRNLLLLAVGGVALLNIHRDISFDATTDLLLLGVAAIAVLISMHLREVAELVRYRRVDNG